MPKSFPTAILLSLTFILMVSACGSNHIPPEHETTEGTPSEGSPSESTPPEAEPSSDGLIRTENSQVTYTLPAPDNDGDVSVESALANRRSHRSYQDKSISAEQLSQILWAAYGVTSPRGLRTAPSAGALYPLEVYAVIGNAAGIEPGVYRYIADGHKIERVIDGDVRNELSEAALGQRSVAQAPVTLFFSAVFERTTGRYGERGVNFVYIEVGHSAQNVYLQAEALGLGTCAVGAFTDSSVRKVLNLPADEEPLYLMPVGYTG
jgi:SagB-type dehydrogenase family enzyme